MILKFQTHSGVRILGSIFSGISSIKGFLLGLGVCGRNFFGLTLSACSSEFSGSFFGFSVDFGSSLFSEPMIFAAFSSWVSASTISFGPVLSGSVTSSFGSSLIMARNAVGAVNNMLTLCYKAVTIKATNKLLGSFYV